MEQIKQRPKYYYERHKFNHKEIAYTIIVDKLNSSNPDFIQCRVVHVDDQREAGFSTVYVRFNDKGVFVSNFMLFHHQEDAMYVFHNCCDETDLQSLENIWNLSTLHNRNVIDGPVLNKYFTMIKNGTFPCLMTKNVNEDDKDFAESQNPSKNIQLLLDVVPDDKLSEYWEKSRRVKCSTTTNTLTNTSKITFDSGITINPTMNDKELSTKSDLLNVNVSYTSFFNAKNSKNAFLRHAVENNDLVPVHIVDMFHTSVTPFEKVNATSCALKESTKDMLIPCTENPMYKLEWDRRNRDKNCTQRISPSSTSPVMFANNVQSDSFGRLNTSKLSPLTDKQTRNCSVVAVNEYDQQQRLLLKSLKPCHHEIESTQISKKPKLNSVITNLQNDSIFENSQPLPSGHPPNTAFQTINSQHFLTKKSLEGNNKLTNHDGALNKNCTELVLNTLENLEPMDMIVTSHDNDSFPPQRQTHDLTLFKNKARLHSATFTSNRDISEIIGPSKEFDCDLNFDDIQNGGACQPKINDKPEKIESPDPSVLRIKCKNMCIIQAAVNHIQPWEEEVPSDKTSLNGSLSSCNDIYESQTISAFKQPLDEQKSTLRYIEDDCMPEFPYNLDKSIRPARTTTSKIATSQNNEKQTLSGKNAHKQIQEVKFMAHSSSMTSPLSSVKNVELQSPRKTHKTRVEKMDELVSSDLDSAKSSNTTENITRNNGKSIEKVSLITILNEEVKNKDDKSATKIIEHNLPLTQSLPVSGETIQSQEHNTVNGANGANLTLLDLESYDGTRHLEFQELKSISLEAFAQRSLLQSVEEVTMFVFSRLDKDTRKEFKYATVWQQVYTVLHSSYYTKYKFLTSEHLRLYMHALLGCNEVNTCVFCPTQKTYKKATSLQKHFYSHHALAQTNYSCPTFRCPFSAAYPYEFHQHAEKCCPKQYKIKSWLVDVPWILQDAFADYIRNRDSGNNKCYLIRPGLLSKIPRILLVEDDKSTEKTNNELPNEVKTAKTGKTEVATTIEPCVEPSLIPEGYRTQKSYKETDASIFASLSKPECVTETGSRH